MSTEQNRALIRGYLEDVWGKADYAVEQKVVGQDIIDHNPIPGQVPGIAGHHQAVSMFHAAISDVQMTVEQMVAEGNLVADHWTCSATHTGSLFGIPATGRRFTFTGTDMSRISDGKIVEVWHVEDFLGLLQQLGAALAPPQSGSRAPGARPAAAGIRSASAPASDGDVKAYTRRAFDDLINQGDFAVAAEMIAPDFVGHFPGFPPAHGPAGLQQVLATYRTAFPDQHVTVDEVIAEGDIVACRVTFSGTHTGPLMGMPPTGKQFKVPGLQIMRMAAGKVAEQWANSDDLGMLQQLGLVPVPGQAAP